MPGDLPPRPEPIDYARPRSYQDEASRPTYRTSRLAAWSLVASIASCPYATTPFLLMMAYDENTVPAIALALPIVALGLSIAAYVHMIYAPQTVTGAGMATISIWISAVWVLSCGCLLWFTR